MLTGVAPPTALVQTTSFVIQLSGSGFSGNSTAFAGGTSLTTVFNSNDLVDSHSTCGAHGSRGILDITVTTPAPGGGSSGTPVKSTIGRRLPLPFALRIACRCDGCSYGERARFRHWCQCSNRECDLPDDVHFLHAVERAAFAAFARRRVVVDGSESGAIGGRALNLEITPVAPTITSIAPSPALVGDPIRVFGTNYVAGSTVLLRRGRFPTQFVSATELTATIPVTATTGAADVVVQNPAQGGGLPLNSVHLRLHWRSGAGDRFGKPHDGIGWNCRHGDDRAGHRICSRIPGPGGWR